MACFKIVHRVLASLQFIKTSNIILPFSGNAGHKRPQYPYIDHVLGRRIIITLTYLCITVELDGLKTSVDWGYRKCRWGNHRTPRSNAFTVELTWRLNGSTGGAVAIEVGNLVLNSTTT